MKKKKNAISRRHIAVALLLVPVVLFVLHQYGRSLWYPLMVKIGGGKTLDERMREIEIRHPDLIAMAFQDVQILAFKAEGRLDVYNQGRRWESYPLSARSGGPGPKLREGDRQIPEGVYRVEGLNPNSSYHLSLRINYPNTDDLARAAAMGIENPGSDIYIHGKGVSVGCLAIGDAAIERLFYAVRRSGFDKVAVIIAPAERPEALAAAPEHGELYAKTYQELRRAQGGKNEVIPTGGGSGKGAQNSMPL